MGRRAVDLGGRLHADLNQPRARLREQRRPRRRPQADRPLHGRRIAVVQRGQEVLDADLVALGTHGHSGLKHFFLGSVAERVVHHAPCPVITTRQPADSEPVDLSADVGAAVS